MILFKKKCKFVAMNVLTDPGDSINKRIFIFNEKIYSLSFQVELIVNQDVYLYSGNHLMIPSK